MIRKLAFQVLIGALVLLGLAGVFLGFMIYCERQAKELAVAFCASIKAGDNPAEALARVSRAGVLPSSLVWFPPDASAKTLEVLFKGGMPRSAHGCRVEATGKITGAAYFHTR